MRSILSTIALGVSWASFVVASRPNVPRAPAITAEAQIQQYATGWFDQLLDHDKPALGTFKQRYFWSTEYWKGPGSPVILFQPGEQTAEGFQGYLFNKTITGVYAQEFGGAGLILEHRYWGESSPVDTLTPKTMQQLTFKNALADAVYFAKNVELPFDNSTKSSPQNAPWILAGGSYSGAQAGWTAATLPGTFWAYHASSAPVEAIWDYAKDALKNKFMLGDLRDDDFAAAIMAGPFTGQTTSWTQAGATYEFCDYIENVHATPPAKAGPGGVGPIKGLEGYAQWWTTSYFPGACAGYGYWTDQHETACFDTYNSSNPLYSDKTIGNAADLFYHSAAPKGVPSIVSHLVTADYLFRTCGTFFQPDDGYTYASANGKRSDSLNAWTKGWTGTTERVIWAQGQYDPWREETISSDFRPGGPATSTEPNPIFVMPEASHCYDLLWRNGDANAGIRDVQNKEIAQMKVWVDEWYAKK
uniref:Putative serine protease EDA2 n=1 Tax=Talaromyces marneffei PM1 TaxID=1077442 RepID=A0A093W226_TALMA